MQKCEVTHSVLPCRGAAVVTNNELPGDMPSFPDGQGKNTLFLPPEQLALVWLDLDSWALVATVWQEPPSSLAFPEELLYY